MKHSLFFAVFATSVSILVCIGFTLLLPVPEMAPLTESVTVTEPTATIAPQPPGYDEQTTITVLLAAGTEQMSLHDYLLGVIPAEMPSEFAPEAQKAQAVAARTFTLRTISGSKHDGAICTDSTCCQAWIDPATLSDAVRRQTQSVLLQTDGQVCIYDGQLIDALFFSCSGGRTEAAVAVWGRDVAYLQAVDSDGEEDAPPYSDTVTVSGDEFCRQTGASGDPEQWFGDIERTDGGGVAIMDICGRSFTGVELRKLFGLRSANFTVECDGDSVSFHTLGYGHRVGMSQYGADAMAREGADYEEILKHYYQGIEIETRQ